MPRTPLFIISSLTWRRWHNNTASLGPFANSVPQFSSSRRPGTLSPSLTTQMVSGFIFNLTTLLCYSKAVKLLVLIVGRPCWAIFMSPNVSAYFELSFSHYSKCHSFDSKHLLLFNWLFNLSSGHRIYPDLWILRRFFVCLSLFSWIIGLEWFLVEFRWCKCIKELLFWLW